MPDDQVEDFLKTARGGAAAADPVADFLATAKPVATATAEAPKPVDRVATERVARLKATGGVEPTGPYIPPQGIRDFAGQSDSDRAGFVADVNERTIAESAAAERATHGYLRRAIVDAPADAAIALGQGASKGAVAFNEGLDKIRQTGETFAKNALDRSARTPFQARDDVAPDEGITRARSYVERESARQNPTVKSLASVTDPIAEMAGSIASSMVAGPKFFSLIEGLKHPEAPLKAAAEAELFMRFQGAVGKAMAGADPSTIDRIASTAASTWIASVAGGEDPVKAIGVSLAFAGHEASRRAEPRLGVNNPGATAEARMAPSRETTARVVNEAVARGDVTEREAFSPERVAVAEAAAAKGGDPVAAVEAMPKIERPDGSVAEASGLANPTLDPRVAPTVEAARARGLDTVSSGMGEDGRPFVIGRDAQGETVVERGEPPASARPEAPVRPTPKLRSTDAIEREAKKEKSLSQVVRELGGFDYNRSGGFTGELDMLRQKDSASSGLVKTKAGGGKSPEEMMQAVRELGFEVDPEMNGGDFVKRVVEDVESGGRDLVPGSDRGAAMADVEYRRAMEAEQAKYDEWRRANPEEARQLDEERAYERDERAAIENENAPGGDDSFGFGRNNEPTPPSGPEVTSVKNRVVNEDRAARGVDPMVEALRRAQPDVVDEALSKIRENKDLARQTSDDLVANPRPHTDVEVALLNIHRVDLYNERDLAAKQGEEFARTGQTEAAAKAAERYARADADLVATEIASKQSGTKTAQGLAMRRIEMARDYSLPAMEMRRRAQQNFEPLDARQKAETEALYEARKAKQDEFNAQMEKMAGEESARAIDEWMKSETAAEKPTRSKAIEGDENKIVTKEAYEKAKAEFREKLRGMSSSAFASFEALPSLAKMAVYHIERGVRGGFAAWSKLVKDEFGDVPDAKLQEAWGAAKAYAKGATVEKVADKIRESVKEGKGIGSNEAGKLAEMFVRSGIHGRDAVVDAVHEVLKGMDPTITRSETQRAIADYAKVKTMNQDPVKVELRDIKAQLVQLERLRDMAEGKAPPKQGLQRDAQSDALRELTRLVNEAKRKGGFTVTDPAKALRTALEAAKTRMRNSIADMTREMAAGKKDVPTRTEVPLDAEGQALKAQRDALRKQYDEVFGRTELTDAQRLDAAIKAAEKSLAEWERKVATGDVFPKAKGPEAPVDPRLAELRAQRDELRQVAQDMKDAATPKKSQVERDTSALVKRLTKKAAELERRIAERDYEKKARRDTSEAYRNPDAIRLQAELNLIDRRFNEAVFKDKLARRNLAQKAASAVFIETPQTARAIMTGLDFSAVLRQGGITVLSHPIRSAKALGEMFRAFASPEAQARSEAQIAMRPNYNLAKRSGLFLSEHGDTTLAKMEEAYQSRWAQHIPGVAGSQRAYTTFLNRLRMDSFDAAIANLSRGTRPTPAEAKAMAAFVNVTTGRGGMKGAKWDNALTGLNQVFFSPRLVASRFQYLLGPVTGFRYGGGSMRTRALIASEYARFLAGAAVVYGLGALAGAKVEDDPESSDAGKLRFGNTRLDPLAGLAQVTTFVARQAGDIKDAAHGKKTRSYETMAQFMRTKLAPGPGAYVDVTKGTNVVGERVKLSGALTGLVTPMGLRGKDKSGGPAFVTGGDIHRAMIEQGVPAGTALAILSIFGMSLNNYKRKKK